MAVADYFSHGWSLPETHATQRALWAVQRRRPSFQQTRCENLLWRLQPLLSQSPPAAPSTAWRNRFEKHNAPLLGPLHLAPLIELRDFPLTSPPSRKTSIATSTDGLDTTPSPTQVASSPVLKPALKRSCSVPVTVWDTCLHRARLSHLDLAIASPRHQHHYHSARRWMAPPPLSPDIDGWTPPDRPTSTATVSTTKTARACRFSGVIERRIYSTTTTLVKVESTDRIELAHDTLLDGGDGTRMQRDDLLASDLSVYDHPQHDHDLSVMGQVGRHMMTVALEEEGIPRFWQFDDDDDDDDDDDEEEGTVVADEGRSTWTDSLRLIQQPWQLGQGLADAWPVRSLTDMAHLLHAAASMRLLGTFL